MTTSTAPVIDEHVLARLEEELEDRHILGEFLRRYLKLLDHRVDRLDHAITARDPEACMDALLSLKTSSAMAGAIALAQAAASVQDQLTVPPPGQEDWPEPQERAQIIADLHSVAEATRNHLVHFLSGLFA